jgi:hypothetical protein
MEYLINQGHARPLYYLRVGPRAPLGRSWVALYAMAVVRIWLHTAASRG